MIRKFLNVCYFIILLITYFFFISNVLAASAKTSAKTISLTPVKAIATKAPAKNQAWTDFIFSGPIHTNSKITYFLQTQPRYYFHPDRLGRVLAIAGIGYKINARWELMLGYKYLSINKETGSRQVNAYWPQLTGLLIKCKHFTLNSRTRLEIQKKARKPQWHDQFREKITIKFPKLIFNKLTPVFSDEIFLSLTQPIWVGNRNPRLNRAFVGLDIPLFKKSFIEVGYLNQVTLPKLHTRSFNMAYIGLNIRT